VLPRHLFVPRLPGGVRVAAEARQELLLHLHRVQLGQAAQVEICETKNERNDERRRKSYEKKEKQSPEGRGRGEGRSPRSSLRSSSSGTVAISLPLLQLGSETSVCGQEVESRFDSGGPLPAGTLSPTGSRCSSSYFTLLLTSCRRSGGLSAMYKGAVYGPLTGLVRPPTEEHTKQ